MANHTGRYPKGMRREYRAALDQGWTVERSHSGKHWAWWPPGASVPLWSTSSHAEGRAYANHRATLKRNGLVLP